MVLMVLVAGCIEYGTGSELELTTDTSYRGFTELQQVSAECAGDDIVVRGRTKGWMEEVQVEIWGPLAPSTPDGYQRAELQTVAFTENEFCDVFEATLPAESGYACADHDAGTLTYFVRVQFEVGCGGMKAWGLLDEDDVYDQSVTPIPGDADCDLTDPDSYDEDDLNADVRVLPDVVSPCSVEVP